MNLKRGFTLIELLVVVAIIGILSSVVLASLNSARIKGSDAAVKANLANLRGQAAICYDGGCSTVTAGNYGAGVTCTFTAAGAMTGCASDLFADETFRNGMKAAASAGGATGANPVTGYTNAAGDAWAVHSPVKNTTDLTFCVDSAGAAKKNSTAQALTGLCS
ncbi:MAG: type II secretion system protein [Minisyncoccia bacterium]